MSIRDGLPEVCRQESPADGDGRVLDDEEDFGAEDPLVAVDPGANGGAEQKHRQAHHKAEDGHEPGQGRTVETHGMNGSKTPFGFPSSSAT